MKNKKVNDMAHLAFLAQSMPKDERSESNQPIFVVINGNGNNVACHDIRTDQTMSDRAIILQLTDEITRLSEIILKQSEIISKYQTEGKQ